MAEPIIALPVLSSQRHVKLPPGPTNPPGPRDITNALRLTDDLVNARRRNEVTDQDVFNAALYQHKLISATAVPADAQPDAQPDYVQALQQALKPMNNKMDKLTNGVQKLTDDIQAVRDDLNALKDDIQAVKKEQGHIRRISAILYNRSQGSGDDTALEIVPFESGDDPTKPPHNLPALTAVRAVAGLSPAQRDAYHRAYCGNQNPRTPSAQRTPAIFTAIGANRY